MQNCDWWMNYSNNRSANHVSVSLTIYVSRTNLRFINLFKKVWTYGFLIQLLLLAITIPVSLLLYSPLIQELVSQFSTGNFDPERIDALSIPSSFSGLLSFYGISLLLGAVKYLFYCGFYKIVRDIDEDREANFKDVFLYFKPNFERQKRLFGGFFFPLPISFFVQSEIITHPNNENLLGGHKRIFVGGQNRIFWAFEQIHSVL